MSPTASVALGKAKGEEKAGEGRQRGEGAGSSAADAGLGRAWRWLGGESSWGRFTVRCHPSRRPQGWPTKAARESAMVTSGTFVDGATASPGVAMLGTRSTSFMKPRAFSSSQAVQWWIREGRARKRYGVRTGAGGVQWP